MHLSIEFLIVIGAIRGESAGAVGIAARQGGK
jgi:hypothetical protein